MIETARSIRLLLCIVLLCAPVVPAHGGNMARDTMMAMVVSLTSDAAWTCEGGQTCQRLRDAQVEFVSRGDNLFVMSNVQAFTGRYDRGDWSTKTVRLERGVIIQPDPYAQNGLGFQFHVEYMAGTDVYPISLHCKKVSNYYEKIQVVSCQVTAGTPGANSVYQSQSVLTEEIRWRRE